MRYVLVLACLCGTAGAGSVPDLAFARGKLLLAIRDEVGALAAFDEVVEKFPASRQAGEAAMQALDLLNRECRFDEMQDRVERWMNDRPLVRRNRELAVLLRRLFFSFARRDDRPPPHTDWEREALERLAEFAENPTVPYGDELLYEAGWQFQVSEHPDAAARAWRVLIAVYPRSALVRRAHRARRAGLLIGELLQVREQLRPHDAHRARAVR